ncbi:MAG: hypothetical protein KDD43_07905 [Bdellovibrionales bacterium]|nr:hypothetical protein [Bdellovibrionales bacterium]
MVQVSRDCLSSPIVVDVIFAGEGSNETRIQPCRLKSYARFWERSYLESRHRELKERIEILTRATMLGFSKSRRPFHLKVTSQDPFQFEWKSDTLNIGWEWTRAAGHLEKALLQEWLRRQNNVIQQDRFQQEVLGYLILGFLQDHLMIEDPYTREKIDLQSPASWLRWAMNLEEYCYSPWVSYDQLSFCDRTRQLSSAKRRHLRSLREVEKTALAPLVASLLWQRYKSSGLGEKQAFWDGLKSSIHEQGVLTRWQWESFVQPKHLDDLRDWVNMTASIYWESLGFVDEGKWEWIPEGVDILVEGSKLPANRLEELIHYGRAHPEVSVVVYSKEGRALVSSGSTLGLKVDGLRSQYHILASCGSFSRRNLKKVAEKRILVVDFCKPDQEINWSALMQGGWESFIGQNPSMKFLGLFMPAVRKFKSWPAVFHFRDSDFKRLAIKLGWESQNWDDSLAAIRPSGVWDAVPFYRL